MKLWTNINNVRDSFNSTEWRRITKKMTSFGQVSLQTTTENVIVFQLSRINVQHACFRNTTQHPMHSIHHHQSPLSSLACQTPFAEWFSQSPFERFTRFSIMPGTCNECDNDKNSQFNISAIILSNNRNEFGRKELVSTHMSSILNFG